MIKVDNFILKEASRVWGDVVEKTAFEVDINGPNILGAIAGGYAGTKAYNRSVDKKKQNVKNSQTLENNYYDDIQKVLNSLKIVFTPINVIFSVNDQVFEIIKTNEMNVEMKKKFLEKDGVYFKNLLVNKMNMELQLAERVFARQMLQPHLPENIKISSFVGHLMEKVATSELDESFENTMKKTASDAKLKMKIDLDTLRPFDKYTNALGVSDFLKVAKDNMTLKDLKKNVKVSFLPDRVLFLLNGKLMEQMTLTSMNEEGYKAFKKRDSDFFLNFFHDEVGKINNQLFTSVLENEKPSVDESVETPSLYKDAATLEEVISDTDRAWIEELASERNYIDLFLDPDVHPVVYDALLDEMISPNWHELELEAVLKEIEVLFKLNEPIGDRALDKIATLHTIQNEDNSMFATSFSFEKFLRAMNNKSVLITTFEGGLEFEEIMFALDIAKAIVGEDCFLEFGNTLPAYLSEELFQDGIRYVSEQIYDENNIPEKLFWDDVNSFLRRKWKEKDSMNQLGEELNYTNKRTEKINELSETILKDYAEHISFESPYNSSKEFLLNNLEGDTTMVHAIANTTSRHLICALYLEVKKEEVVVTLDRAKEVYEK